ncbi:MAG: hypothetical protein ACRDH2_12055, partial [Anaerolineales bacterium]
MSRRITFLILVGLALVAQACRGSSPTNAPNNNPTAPGATAANGATDVAAARNATLSQLDNAVEARADENTDWTDAAEGDEIVTGGATKTGDEARVRVDISDGTIVRVGPNSEFRLVELSAEADDPVTRFFLDAGKMWV